ncbi:hypothetical protein DXG01_005780 [Tephrocybe rancida]|nr:hypothetical protein DXG01_005780 [Tephrocybe rancida]
MPRSGDGAPISATPLVGIIPEDIVREIVDLLPSADILSFSLTKLSVRPNYYLAWPKADEALEESWVASMISKIAEHLKLLHTFDWDGLEVPVDSMWGTLRRCCPNLQNIFSNVGLRSLSPDSQLDTVSTEQVGATVCHAQLYFVFSQFEDLFPVSEALPAAFWDMLIDRCPNLEELAICSFSSSTRVFDFLPLTEARWPKLHTLTLGSFGYQADFTLGAAEQTHFCEFLEHHATLKYLRLQWNFKRWMSPVDLRLELSPDALPELNTFVGIYQQLAKLPNSTSIETLDLTCEPLHEYRLLHWLLELKRFSLTKGHRYRDESMLESALLILSSKPSLEQINIRWAREKAPNHLKQEGTYDIISKEGHPSHIAVHEQGIPLFGRPFDREYKFTLSSSTILGSVKQLPVLQILRNR